MKASRFFKLGVMLIGLLFVVVVIAAFFRRNDIVFLVLLCGSTAVLIKERSDMRALAPFFVAGILGPLMEMILIHYGVWQYANATFGGIPLWLPLLWGCTGYALMKIATWLTPRC